jgi:transcriptional regulator with PAS, ATPase and Fis domain
MPGLSLEGAGPQGEGSEHSISELALRAARSQSTILITGETGVGKGHFARWIHENSTRADKPFVPVNCGAIPDTLIDSHLFGHVRGAFSGAARNHAGLIRAAEGGTLFLDEVAALPPSAQARLLRLLQEREVQPVGRHAPIQVDVRVIAATNSELQQAIDERRFRDDLYFRLHVIHFHLRPLRERRDEIDGLVDEFNSEMADLYQQPKLRIEAGAMHVLRAHAWPGNVRQLRTVIERLAVLAPGESISADRLRSLGQLGPDAAGDEKEPEKGCADGGCEAPMAQIKAEVISRVLAESGGSVARAARRLGVHRSTMYRWLRRDSRS